jgi:hypothetical protein
MATFEIEREGRTYRCERVITGTRVQRQTVIVHGIGRKPDSADYGASLRTKSYAKTRPHGAIRPRGGCGVLC